MHLSHIIKSRYAYQLIKQIYFYINLFKIKSLTKFFNQILSYISKTVSKYNLNNL